jgi:hypothetical protein
MTDAHDFNARFVLLLHFTCKNEIKNSYSLLSEVTGFVRAALAIS